MEDRCCFGIKANFILDTLDFTQTFKDIFLFGVLGGLLDVLNQAYMLAGFEPVNKLLNEDVFFLCTRKPGHLLSALQQVGLFVRYWGYRERILTSRTNERNLRF